MRIGPGATTLRLVDHHDNDRLGQGAPQALFLRTLRIDAASTLENPGGLVYYVNLENEGTVTHPENFVALIDWQSVSLRNP